MRESKEGESGVWVFDSRERDRKMKMSLSFVFIDDVVFGWQENLRKIEIVSTSFFFLILKLKRKKGSPFFLKNLN